MTNRALTPHPDAPTLSITRIEATLAWTGADVLSLTFRAFGDVKALAVPPPAPVKRVDGLWRSTCFEAFVKDPIGEGYYEFNFSPSGEWAAYRFSAYRTGMRDAQTAAPRIVANLGEDHLEVRTEWHAPSQRHARLGLSAVIEEKSGAKSYWALVHPSDKPDFHHPDGFALELV